MQMPVRVRRQRRWQRAVLIATSTLSSLILVGILAVLTLTNTDWGRERIRAYAEGWLNHAAHGQVRIGRLSGNMLHGVMIHNFSIRDSTGGAFVAVDSMIADYSVLSLARKHVWIRNAIVYRPVIVLDKPTDGVWNWRRIFPRDTTPKPPSQQQGWGDWIRFTNSQVINGSLVVRSAWHPSENLTPAGRDSAVREVMSGDSRLMVERVPGGFQKIIRLDSLTASFPLFRLAEPGFETRLAQVASLSMVAYPFRPPGAVVTNLMGSFPFTDDSVWWHGIQARLPQTRIGGDGSYVFDTGDLTLTAHAEPFVFADMRWMYPRLPSNGRGKADVSVVWRGATNDYAARNADLTVGEAHITGSIGITQTDSVALHDTNLRFTGVDTRLLEQLIPHFKSPRRGVLSGRTIASGGKHALVLDSDVTFADSRGAGTSRLIARGEVGFLDKGGVRARRLRVEMRPLQVELARTFRPSLPVSGVLTGTVFVDGSTTSQLAVVGDVDHMDRGEHSALHGSATIGLSGSQRFDADVIAHPISLVEVGRFFPSVGLQGSATGAARLSGTLADLRVSTDMRLPDNGRFALQGRLNLAARQKSYDVTTSLYTLNLRTILARAPVTSLTMRGAARGAGFELATMRSTFAADLSASSLDTIAIDSASVRASIADGLARIERLEARGSHALASAQGTFGLVRGRSGELTYRVDVDSLGAFNRFLPRSASDTGMMAPRPGVTARAFARARADSARIDRATEVERAISGAAAPRLAVNPPKPVRRDTVAGSLFARGTIRGNIYDFDLRGRAAGENVVARGNFVRRFATEYVLTGVRTAEPSLVLALDADSVSAFGFALDTLAARLTWKKPGGHIELAIRQDADRDYGVKGDFSLFPDRRQVRISALTLRLDTAYWSAPHASMVEWGGPGIRVNDFELRNRSNGRLFANGLLPTKGVANLDLWIVNFPVQDLTSLLESDVDVQGITTLRGHLGGTLEKPTFQGAFGFVQGKYNGAVVPELRAQVGYADRQLAIHGDILRNDGQRMAVIDGRVPINLALSGVPAGESRLLPDPMSVDVVADSLPLELIPQFTDFVSNTHGLAAGKISMRGTLKRPSLAGGFTLSRASVTLAATGQTIDSLNGAVRMANDTVFVDSLVGKSGGPVRVRGRLFVGDWREPAFDLYLVAQDAELLHNDRGRLRADAGLSLTGPFRSAYLSGQVDVLRGVIYAPEPSGRHVIGAGDPALFNVMDTSIVSDRELFPAHSPLLANLRAEVAVNIHTNTWVRNREANVEIYTEYPMMVRVEQEAFALTGIITTERGEYKFLSKRFQIKRGTAVFVGSPEINPTLQVTGEYEVRVPSRNTINVRVLIAGTMRKPRLSLESDAQPPKTQSELLSLLAFGQPTTSFLSVNGSSIAGSGGTGDLFGVGAQLAVKRLAGVAMGVMVEEIESEAGKALGADVFNITPADVPAELIQLRGVGNFLTQTRIEAGKYVNPRTFVTAQETGGRLGAGFEHRTADGWRFRASFEPRLLLLEPTLSKQSFNAVRAYGGLVAREWRF
jgi:translocation and assembly module TamB